MNRRKSVIKDLGLGKTGLGMGALMVNLGRKESLARMSFVDNIVRSSTLREKDLEPIPE
jgi:hypothetical protein